MASLYSPLDDASYEVRMLSFPSSTASPMIECTMRTFSLFRNPPIRYVALSYCWGDASITTNIYVNGLTVAVTLNLEAALRRLRQTLDPSIMVWADALCMNQNDNREKGQQVRLMTQIYAKAETCHAWLGGRGFENVEAAMRSMARFDDLLSSPNNIQQNESLRAACSEFLSFCRCPYWQRRWIIQELTASQDVRIMCLNETLSFEVIRSVYDSCSRSEFWLSEHRLVAESFARILDFRFAYHEGRQLSLPTAIVQTQRFLSNNEHDKIFALIGICDDGPTLVPAPNYMQTTDDISRDLTRALLRRNANFDVIFQDRRMRNDPTRQTSLPTWAPDWYSKDLGWEVVGAANTKSDWPRSLAAMALRGDPDILRMEGCTLGIIVTLSSPLSRDVSPHGTTLAMADMLNAPCKYYGSRIKTFLALNELLFSSQSITGVSNISRLASSRVWGIPLLHDFSFPHCFRNNEQFWDNGQPFRSFTKIRYILMLTIGPFLIGTLLSVPALSVTCYFWYTGSAGSIWIAVMVPISISLAVVSLGFTLWGLYDFLINLGNFLSKGHGTYTLFVESVEDSRRLYILDTGMCGTTRSSAEIGDRVCSLAGCTRVAILRANESEESASYTVVGSTRIVVNQADASKCSLYHKLQKTVNGEGYGVEPREQFDDFFAEARAKDWWENFSLV